MDKFKVQIEKARKFNEDNGSAVNDIAHSSLKNSEDIDPHTWKKGTTLIMGDSILFQVLEDKLCKKGTIKVQCFPRVKFDDFYHYAIPLIN